MFFSQKVEIVFEMVLEILLYMVTDFEKVFEMVSQMAVVP